jgi:hypothetical protein
MTAKWIKVPVTLHVPGPNFAPFVYDNNGAPVSGKYDITAVPPNTPVELDEAEADKLLDRYEDAEELTDKEVVAFKAALAEAAEAARAEKIAKRTAKKNVEAPASA